MMDPVNSARAEYWRKQAENIQFVWDVTRDIEHLTRECQDEA